MLRSSYCMASREIIPRESEAQLMSAEPYPKVVSPDQAREASSLSSRRGVAILLLLSLVQFMDILDASILNIALPSIKHDLGFSQQSLLWVVNGYILTYGGFLLLGGRMADLLGRRLVLVTGLVVFAGSSLLGGLAHSESLLIGARIAQGLGAAGADQQRFAVGESAEQRGAGEDDQPGDQDEAATEQVGHPAAEQQEAAVGEDVTVDDPLQALLAEAEVVLDRRQRDVQDRGVQDVHELDEAEQEQDRDAAPRRQRRHVRRLIDGRNVRVGLGAHWVLLPLWSSLVS